MTDRLATGIDPLDRALEGGVPGGSVVALQTDPASQGELLLRTVARTHETLYLTVTRGAAEVSSWLGVDDAASGFSGRVASVPTSDPLAAVVAALDSARGADATPFVVLDPVNPFEAAAFDDDTYLAILRTVVEWTRDVGGVAFLHGLLASDDPPARWLTLQMADAVWTLVLDVKVSQVATRLAVTKTRGVKPPKEPLKLVLGEAVDVDTSRDIA